METEAIILRTYPLKEADKIVSFFSRTYGKARGVARGARRPKNRYGAALEPLSYVRLWCFERQTAELLSIDHCELIQSYFDTQKDYEAGVALGYLAEVTEQLLPEREPNDAFFRLLLVALEEIRRAVPAQSAGGSPPALCAGTAGGQIWAALTYFDLWAVRLAGLLPPLGRLSSDSQELAREMLATPLAGLKPRPWTRRTALDLRRFLERRIESHIERRLKTRTMLEQL